MPRNWKKNLDETSEEKNSKKENIDQDDKTHPEPPGAPDRTPIEEPEEKKKPPIGDPRPPSKKKPRL